jgi:hypothetical protein
LAFSDAVGKRGGLEHQVGFLVKRVVARPIERTLKTRAIAQLIGCLRRRSVDNCCVQLKRVH